MRLMTASSLPFSSYRAGNRKRVNRRLSEQSVLLGTTECKVLGVWLSGYLGASGRASSHHGGAVQEAGTGEGGRVITGVMMMGMPTPASDPRRRPCTGCAKGFRSTSSFNLYKSPQERVTTFISPL